MISGLLVYGAHNRNANAILVWITLAVISCIIYAVFGVLLIIAFTEGVLDTSAAMFSILTIAGAIFFQIWTIFVAKSARKEIKEENTTNQDESNFVTKS